MGQFENCLAYASDNIIDNGAVDYCDAIDEDTSIARTKKGDLSMELYNEGVLLSDQIEDSTQRDREKAILQALYQNASDELSPAEKFQIVKNQLGGYINRTVELEELLNDRRLTGDNFDQYIGYAAVCFDGYNSIHFYKVEGSLLCGMGIVGTEDAKEDSITSCQTFFSRSAIRVQQYSKHNDSTSMYDLVGLIQFSMD